ncbi:FAD-dependent oxidoreductase [Spirulina major]|uniref:FAD-dependent oxidoreductase n=1 Tax=Spirulina major TaxID=270636 RepID=UPI000933471B
MVAKKRVIVVGAGWAGLGATDHLARQGYDVTLLEASAQPGGLVAGWRTADGRSIEGGIHGFWYPYRNIFQRVKELGLKPFTPFTQSHQYSPHGLEAIAPLFQNEFRLPSPLGTFLYTQFPRLPLSDRLSALPLLRAVIDFDNSDAAWRRYDKRTARELFQEYGVSERLYTDAFNPMLLVGLFAPGEQCSAAAALGMLYYFILAHQPDFDVVWCRGTVGEMIFRPWVQQIEALGGEVLTNHQVTDVVLNSQGQVTGVICGDRQLPADAVIFAISISGMKKLVQASSTLAQYPEFRNLLNLGGIDVLASRFWFDRKVNIPQPSNACFGFDDTTGWTFFDLNTLHDEYHQEPGSVVEVDFYHANQLLAMNDADLSRKIHQDLITCIPDFSQANIVDQRFIRVSQGVTHFAPGSYQHLQRAQSPIPNLFFSGDWVITDHGSWSQEKAYVTGLEAANLVCQQLKRGKAAEIIPVEPDEPHIAAMRSLNQLWRTMTGDRGFFA